MIYGEGVIGKSMLQSLKMAILTSMTGPRAKDLLNLTKTISKHFLMEESCQTSRELAKKMNCDQKMILNHLYSMGFAEKLGAGCLMSLAKTKKNQL